MNNQRWQVLHGATGVGHGWIAQPKEEGPGAVFDTWREAMDYADRMSRTVEVELPRNSTKAGRFTIATQPHPMRHITEIASNKTTQTLRVVETELEPLALALLAHHYNSKDTP